MTEINVLMACYQGERFLPEQLASLRAQDAADFAVLLQDDGSTDGTGALLQSVCQADARFRLGREAGRHLGAIGNFWSLLAQSDSPYAALCDQDDCWEPNRLSRCLAALQTLETRYGAETPLMVHSDCRVVDASGAPLHESFFRHQGWSPRAVTLPPLLVQNNVTGCTLMMNAALRRLLVDHGDPARMVMHDWFIALTAAAFGHIAFLDEPLVRYRQHGQNVKGASQDNLARRGVAALSRAQRGKARVALTYRHAEAFCDAYGDALPAAARQVIDRYLATEALSKLRRVIAVQRGGYAMQSPITRAGQILFG